MALWQQLAGELSVELTSADIGAFLSEVQSVNFALMEIEQSGPIKIRFRIRRQDYKKLEVIALKRGARLEVRERFGLYWHLLRLQKRPVLAIGFLILLAVSLWVPGRIFFVRVEGNVITPTRKILESAAQCGLSFGSSRRDVRSEKLKNAILDAMPELSWAGVNTYGCTAVITVQEKSEEPTKVLPKIVSSIIASRDGIIYDMTVMKGNALCAVGQAIKKGQVLISGYNDCGLCIQATEAKGEIFAFTTRSLTAVSPANYSAHAKITDSETKYSLIIGNKRINFVNSSGISGTGCAKIYKENYIVLPGGFQLPLAICEETTLYYAFQETQVDPSDAELSAYSRQYLLQQMFAGSILLADEKIAVSQGVMILQGDYSCSEMIGIARIEENILDYVKNG